MGAGARVIIHDEPTSSLGEIDPRGPLTLAFNSNMTRDQYEDAVRKGKLKVIEPAPGSYARIRADGA